ncbi:DUF4214 domain-containing protein [Iamia sp. SCSIO 61187]|uniref:DUF4214 domain-containing protein n=1 Tax=Iamia sp. SCSIO 61187 TaxID=2722752 RepID=UPI001C62C0F7|nr:DUF4214 domain-containing protein [Iamia sp. SCSIO 61187]QYG92259.1 DUF4214 domain-containing protein [Iamia sp. SCSIO 61187]
MSLVGAALVAVMTMAMAIAPGAPTGAAEGDVGIEGPAFVESGLPTVTMAESKMWFHDGTWFAAMLRTGEPSSGGSPDADVVVHKRVGTDWIPTSAVIDTRATSKQDVVAVGDTLYVLSHRKLDNSDGLLMTDPDQFARLAKFTYNASTDTYVPVAGFPKVVNQYRVESATMDVDSTGAVWVAWAQSGQVLWQRSTDGGATFSAPAALTVDHATPTVDDIASLVAYGDRVGIMWGDQSVGDDGYWFTSTAAGSGAATWTASEAAFVGTNRGDDHISLKAVGGQIVAAVKTRVGLSNNTLVALLTRSATGTWAATSAWAGITEATRPVVTVDTTNNVAHLFATLPNGTTTAHQGVYHKSTPLAAPSFTPAAQGTPVMTRTGGNIADVTSTKQGVTATSELVVLAADNTSDRYWSAEVAIEEPAAQPPTAPASVTATAGRRSATVSWTAATPGSGPITGYRITSTPALPTPVADQPASARGPITVTVPTGVARTFQVRALSGALVGPPASSASVTPNNHQPFASTAAFADRQAQDFLGRPATDAEKAEVQRILVTEDQAGSAAVLAPEFFAHPSVAGTNGTSDDKVTGLKGLQAQITRLYLAYYLRTPDKGGLEYWVQQRNAGMSLTRVSEHFASLREFRERYGTLTNREFVELIYQNILGRPGEKSGVDFWTAQLDSRRRSRGWVMIGFSESSEYITSTVRTVSVVLVYCSMLDRIPTTEELQAEAGRPSTAAVVDGILAGSEYRARVAS